MQNFAKIGAGAVQTILIGSNIVKKRRQKMGLMKDNIGPAAMLEQMAEEAAELAQASLKLARIIRDENPTPVTYHEAASHLVEEYTDVIQCAEELDLEPDRKQIAQKKDRFFERYSKAKNSMVIGCRRQKETSKYISLILRHKPETIGISLDEHGWANVDELIQGVSKTHPLTMEILERIVTEDEKRRYSFNEDKTLIRANQGHSISVDVELEELQPPEFLYHGTGEKYVESIDKQELIPKSRL